MDEQHFRIEILTLSCKVTTVDFGEMSRQLLSNQTSSKTTGLCFVWLYVTTVNVTTVFEQYANQFLSLYLFKEHHFNAKMLLD